MIISIMPSSSSADMMSMYQFGIHSMSVRYLLSHCTLSISNVFNQHNTATGNTRPTPQVTTRVTTPPTTT
jgi:hypothetical protein